MGIYVLFVFLLLIFLINIQINNKFFGAPAVVFSFSFLLSSIWACAFAQKWDLNLHRNTFIVIFSGVLLFSVVCFFTKYIDNICYADHSKSSKLSDVIVINDRKLIIFILFELVIIFYYIKTLKNITGEQHLSNAISAVYFGDSGIDMPFGIRQALSLMRASSYWFSFVLVNNYLSNKKIQWRLIISIGITAVSTSFSGSRGALICIFLSIPAFFLLLRYRKNKYNRKIELKKIALSVLVLGFSIWCFPRMGDLLGRTTTMDPAEYIAAYIGAEIKNLDLFLSNSEIPANSGTWGSSVFHSLESTLSKYFNFSLQKVSTSSHPFNEVNGYFLGNVYSIFYEPLYDFGYWGHCIIISILAFANQKIFDHSEKKKIKNTVPVIMIIYGYMFPLIFVSFFAWWFGNNVICTSFLYNIIYWNLLNIFFFKIKPLPKIHKLL